MIVGKLVEITAANTDTNVLIVPLGKVLKLKRIEVRNPQASAARIRLWDSFTDYQGNSVSVQKADYTVAAGASVVLDVADSKSILGTLVAQSDVVTVQLYVGGELD